MLQLSVVTKRLNLALTEYSKTHHFKVKNVEIFWLEGTSALKTSLLVHHG